MTTSNFDSLEVGDELELYGEKYKVTRRTRTQAILYSKNDVERDIILKNPSIFKGISVALTEIISDKDLGDAIINE